MRINIIPASELYDQHLVAEYREIKMLPKAFLRSYNSKNGIDVSKIPASYTLNKGHGYFFYNKLKFIENRFQELLDEMGNRGFEANYRNLGMDECRKLKDFDYWYNDYSPTESEMNINRERIALRKSERPNFYRYKGVLV